MALPPSHLYVHCSYGISVLFYLLQNPKVEKNVICNQVPTQGEHISHSDQHLSHTDFTKYIKMLIRCNQCKKSINRIPLITWPPSRDSVHRKQMACHWPRKKDENHSASKIMLNVDNKVINGIIVMTYTLNI